MGDRDVRLVLINETFVFGIFIRKSFFKAIDV